MAKNKTTVQVKTFTKNSKKKGKHSKKSSNLKTSKLYSKKYKGQGR